MQIFHQLRTTLAREKFSSFEWKENGEGCEAPAGQSPSYIHRHLLQNITPRNSFSGAVDFEKWQISGKEVLRTLLSVDFCANSVDPLHYVTSWNAVDELGHHEKIYLPGEYGSKIPIILSRPRWTEPKKWIICSQGHNSGMHNSIGVHPHNPEKTFVPAGDREFATWCLRNGMGALSVEHRGFGERIEVDLKNRNSHGCHDAVMHALIVGRTLLGERLIDLHRATSFLQSTIGFDIELGVMGNSSGGTLSLLAAILFPQVHFCIASSCFSSFALSLFGHPHCIEMYIPRICEHFEMGDLIGLITPKKLLLIQGVNDLQFPLRGVRREYRKVQSIYESGNAVDNVTLQIGQQGHRFYSALAESGCRRLGIL